MGKGWGKSAADAGFGSSTDQAGGLLGSDEPAAVELVNTGGVSPAVIVCDHASNRVPRRLGTLGLDAESLADHIAWDPGAAEVARRLSIDLDAPLVLSGYSRLVIDCNRPLGNAQSIAEHSAGIPVPGNHGLSPIDRAIRIDALFRPYHDTIAGLLDARSHRATLLLSIHSFTPFLDGRSRPWPVGVSYWRAPDLAALLRRELSANGQSMVGDNEPYPIDDAVDYTIPTHGEGRGLPSVMIEIRQDGVRTDADVASWAARLSLAYRRIEAEALCL